MWFWKPCCNIALISNAFMLLVTIYALCWNLILLFYACTQPEKIKKRNKGRRGEDNQYITVQPSSEVNMKFIPGRLERGAADKKSVKLPPIAKPHPKTTSGLIGWRNTSLERYGRHARGIAKCEVPVSILFRIWNSQAGLKCMHTSFVTTIWEI